MKRSVEKVVMEVLKMVVEVLVVDVLIIASCSWVLMVAVSPRPCPISIFTVPRSASQQRNIANRRGLFEDLCPFSYQNETCFNAVPTLLRAKTPGAISIRS